MNSQIAAAYCLAYSRDPSSGERELALSFLKKQAAIIKTRLDEKKPVALPPGLAPDVDPAIAAALVDFCHMLFNSNEFVYVN